MISLRSYFKISLLLFSCGQVFLDIHAAESSQTASSQAGVSFIPGKDSYAALNSDPNNPFVLSVGTSMSQTHQTSNTANSEFIRKKFNEIIKRMNPVSDSEIQAAADWLQHKDRIGYTLLALHNYFCHQEHIIFPAALSPSYDAVIINRMLRDVAKNSPHVDELTLAHCPFQYCDDYGCQDRACDAGVTQIRSQKSPLFTVEHQRAMVRQIESLGINSQRGNASGSLPSCRLSLEAADVLQEGSDDFDEEKLKRQANFIRDLGNPMLFGHHYANPAVKPNLFEDKKDADWFAKYCAKIIEKSPQITHMCPISQPIAFAYKTRKQQLSPFENNISESEYLQNITDAQVKAAVAMKKINPKLKVLMSHQWKLMKPKHNSLADPRYLLELGIAKIAHKMYNQQFVDLMSPHSNKFDGIALSLYPPVFFDLWRPEGSNTGGVIDAEGALETIIEVSEAFPGKDIYIVETGCNTKDPQKKRDFIDMTLAACKAARNKGIPVKGVYFWGITNDKEFYFEWNSAPGSTNFAPFDGLDPENPEASINEAGRYIQNILKDSSLSKK